MKINIDTVRLSNLNEIPAELDPLVVVQIIRAGSQEIVGVANVTVCNGGELMILEVKPLETTPSSDRPEIRINHNPHVSLPN